MWTTAFSGSRPARRAPKAWTVNGRHLGHPSTRTASIAKIDVCRRATQRSVITGWTRLSPPGRREKFIDVDPLTAPDQVRNFDGFATPYYFDNLHPFENIRRLTFDAFTRRVSRLQQGLEADPTTEVSSWTKLIARLIAKDFTTSPPALLNLATVEAEVGYNIPNSSFIYDLCSVRDTSQWETFLREFQRVCQRKPNTPHYLTFKPSWLLESLKYDAKTLDRYEKALKLIDEHYAELRATSPGTQQASSAPPNPYFNDILEVTEENGVIFKESPGNQPPDASIFALKRHALKQLKGGKQAIEEIEHVVDMILKMNCKVIIDPVSPNTQRLERWVGTELMRKHNSPTDTKIYNTYYCDYPNMVTMLNEEVQDAVTFNYEVGLNLVAMPQKETESFDNTVAKVLDQARLANRKFPTLVSSCSMAQINSIADYLDAFPSTKESVTFTTPMGVGDSIMFLLQHNDKLRVAKVIPYGARADMLHYMLRGIWMMKKNGGIGDMEHRARVETNMLALQLITGLPILSLVMFIWGRFFS